MISPSFSLQKYKYNWKLFYFAINFFNLFFVSNLDFLNFKFNNYDDFDIHKTGEKPNLCKFC